MLEMPFVRPAEVVCAPVVFHEVEVFGTGGIEGGMDGGEGDVAHWGGGESPVFVGVKGRAVGANPLGGDLDVGVAAVVEGAVHLEAHFQGDAVVDHGGDFGHLLGSGCFFLDDGSDGEDPLPCLGAPGAECCLGKVCVALLGELCQ